MKVLYADHTTLASGAERSLLELLRGLPDDVEPVLACPDGVLSVEAGRAGIRTVRIPSTAGSLRLHALHTARALCEFAAIAVRLRQVAKRESADLMHANTLQVGIAAGLARRLGAPPLVMHVRDCLPARGAGGLVRRWISASSDELIAISRFTAECFGPQAQTVIANAVDLDRFDPVHGDGARVRAELGIAPEAPVMSVVAQITPWKGQRDAIEALALLRSRHPDAHLLLVGETKFTFASTRFDNRAYLAELHSLAERYHLDDCVHFLGERADVPDVLAATNLVLVPSWEEPFGRTIIEAMAMEVPSLATTVGGPAEILDDGIDGALAAPREPQAWADRAAALLSDRESLRAMGQRGRVKARERYSRDRHVARVLEVYGRVDR